MLPFSRHVFRDEVAVTEAEFSALMATSLPYLERRFSHVVSDDVEAKDVVGSDHSSGESEGGEGSAEDAVGTCNADREEESESVVSTFAIAEVERYGYQRDDAASDRVDPNLSSYDVAAPSPTDEQHSRQLDQTADLLARLDNSLEQQYKNKIRNLEQRYEFEIAELREQIGGATGRDGGSSTAGGSCTTTPASGSGERGAAHEQGSSSMGELNRLRGLVRRQSVAIMKWKKRYSQLLAKIQQQASGRDQHEPASTFRPPPPSLTPGSSCLSADGAGAGAADTAIKNEKEEEDEPRSQLQVGGTSGRRNSRERPAVVPFLAQLEQVATAAEEKLLRGSYSKNSSQLEEEVQHEDAAVGHPRRHDLREADLSELVAEEANVGTPYSCGGGSSASSVLSYTVSAPGSCATPSSSSSGNLVWASSSRSIKNCIVPVLDTTSARSNTSGTAANQNKLDTNQLQALFRKRRETYPDRDAVVAEATKMKRALAEKEALLPKASPSMMSLVGEPGGDVEITDRAVRSGRYEDNGDSSCTHAFSLVVLGEQVVPPGRAEAEGNLSHAGQQDELLVQETAKLERLDSSSGSSCSFVGSGGPAAAPVSTVTTPLITSSSCSTTAMSNGRGQQELLPPACLAGIGVGVRGSCEVNHSHAEVQLPGTKAQVDGGEDAFSFGCRPPLVPSADKGTVHPAALPLVPSSSGSGTNTSAEAENAALCSTHLIQFTTDDDSRNENFPEFEIGLAVYPHPPETPIDMTKADENYARKSARFGGSRGSASTSDDVSTSAGPSPTEESLVCARGPSPVASAPLQPPKRVVIDEAQNSYREPSCSPKLLLKNRGGPGLSAASGAILRGALHRGTSDDTVSEEDSVLSSAGSTSQIEEGSRSCRVGEADLLNLKPQDEIDEGAINKGLLLERPRQDFHGRAGDDAKEVVDKDNLPASGDVSLEDSSLNFSRVSSKTTSLQSSPGTFGAEHQPPPRPLATPEHAVRNFGASAYASTKFETVPASAISPDAELSAGGSSSGSGAASRADVGYGLGFSNSKINGTAPSSTASDSSIINMGKRLFFQNQQIAPIIIPPISPSTSFTGSKTVDSLSPCSTTSDSRTALAGSILKKERDLLRVAAMGMASPPPSAASSLASSFSAARVNVNGGAAAASISNSFSSSAGSRDLFSKEPATGSSSTPSSSSTAAGASFAIGTARASPPAPGGTPTFELKLTKHNSTPTPTSITLSSIPSGRSSTSTRPVLEAPSGSEDGGDLGKQLFPSEALRENQSSRQAPASLLTFTTDAAASSTGGAVTGVVKTCELLSDASKTSSTSTRRSFSANDDQGGVDHHDVEHQQNVVELDQLPIRRASPVLLPGDSSTYREKRKQFVQIVHAISPVPAPRGLSSLSNGVGAAGGSVPFFGGRGAGDHSSSASASPSPIMRGGERAELSAPAASSAAAGAHLGLPTTSAKKNLLPPTRGAPSFCSVDSSAPGANSQAETLIKGASAGAADTAASAASAVASSGTVRLRHSQRHAQQETDSLLEALRNGL